MRTYKCEYTNGSRQAKVQADSASEAYKKFLEEQGVFQIPVSVSLGVFDRNVFKDHIKETRDHIKETLPINRKTPEKEAQEKIETLKLSLINLTSTGSYLELPPGTRVTMSSYVSKLIKAFEYRGLKPAEIKFIETWMNVKDRGLGESLIAKRIASLPAAERSCSEFARMMLLGMMTNTTRLENALDDVQDEIASIGDEVGEIQEDVGDMHEGFGFEG